MRSVTSIFGFLTIFAFGTIVSAEIVLEHKKATIESVTCEGNPSEASITFKSLDNPKKTLPLRMERPQGVNVVPVLLCKTLIEFATKGRTVTLVTVPKFNGSLLESEVAVGFIDTDRMRVLTPIYDQSGPPMTSGIDYMRIFRCGNPDRSSVVCLMKDSSQNIYLKFHTPIQFSSEFYKVLEFSYIDANTTAYKILDEEKKERVLTVKSQKEEATASLLIDGEAYDPEFEFPLVKK